MLLGSLVTALAQTVTAQNASKLDDPIGGECRFDNLSMRTDRLQEWPSVTKVGPHNGHLTNSDAYADDDLENVIYPSP
jgi:hypothetical protein